MGLSIYNSLTNKVEEFIPHNEKKVNMYVCGPTVWNYSHIGNARPVIFYDMVKRYLEFCGYEVVYASNITDVDDKIINQALIENISEKNLANKYEKAFFDDLKKVGSLKPDIIPHATDYISDMIEFIDKLIKAGYAYTVDGDVYFRINRISDYGILSNQVQEDLNAGVRINVSEKKENPFDFTLWKKTTEGIKWHASFGQGRPGWHTECVVMNHKIFGDEIDIHGGGMDLKFPHHENEIAQAKALYGHNLARYWMHVGRLQMNGEKMSKSLGNVIYVQDINDFEELMTLRLMIISAPYRSSINYNEELANLYLGEYEKIKKAYKQAKFMLEYYDITQTEVDDKDILEFKKEMDLDFNTPNVMSLINRLVKEINNLIRQKKFEELAIKTNTLKLILDIWGIEVKYEQLSDANRQLYDAWIEARDRKNFAEADKYRQLLMDEEII